MSLSRLSSWCFRHRRLVLLVWVVALVGTNALAGAKGPDYANSFSLPGTESNEAFEILAAQDPERAGGTAEIVFRADGEGGVNDADVRAEMDALFAQVAELDGVVEVQDPYTMAALAQAVEGAPSQTSDDGTIAFARVQFAERAGSVPLGSIEELQALTAASAEALGIQAVVGGFVISQTEEAPPGLAEIAGLIGAVIILLLAFRSVLAMGLPLAVAVFGIGVGLAILTLLTRVVSTPEFAPQIASMIGIGVGIDYALFIVTRHREAMQQGADPEHAAATAMRTAGRAVLFAGLVVVISMLGLLLMGFEFIQGVAVGAALVVLTTMLGSVTLLPALLGFTGRNIDKWSIASRKHVDLTGETTLSYRWSRVMQHHAGVAATLSLLVLLVLAIPVLSMRLGVSDAGNNPESYETRQAYDLLAEGFGPGFNGPFVMAAEINGAEDLEILLGLSADVAALPGVAEASPPLPNEELTAAIIYLNPATSPQDEATATLLDDLRDDVVPTALEGSDIVVRVGGMTAIMADFTTQVVNRLPLFFAVVIGLSILLLMVVFRSVLVPLKAAIMNLLSIGAAYGVIVAIFQWGWFSDIVGIGRPGPIEAWVPIMLFAILFGLSMDYEVFLLSRIREEYGRHGDNALAVANGLARTARVITAAAAIMITVFLAFAIGSDARQLKLFAIGLAVAIFVDATIVRLILVPSTMELLGRANWWLPDWLDRLLPDVHIEGAEDPDEVEGPLAPAHEQESVGV